ncbi:MAG: hypothetical protein K8F91_20005, partial [Candidatus Obscuribacterales bacterium]|nr:hypothetical protein [Candidatus Obscuribacterales bacterium]
KGKGSTATMIASMLDVACGPTALFTSPHLQKHVERMVFNSSRVSEENFARGLCEIKDILEKHHSGAHGPVTYFQSLIAIFFHLVHSSKEPFDWQVIEVGMGGLYDATNVFTHKDVAVFTPISMEHTNKLGRTCSEIATHKAAIITPDCQVVLAPQQYKEAKQVILDRANELGCTVVEVGNEYNANFLSVREGKQHFTVEGPSGLESFTTSLLGEHQMLNAMTALATIACIESSQQEFDREKLKVGLDKAWLPGRLDLLATNPLIIADGAHTQESAAVLHKAVSKFFLFKKTIIVLASNQDKDIKAIFGNLKTSDCTLIATRTHNPKALEPEEILERIGIDTNGPITCLKAESIARAIDTARSIALDNDLILITGSLYAVGEARDYMEQVEQQIGPLLSSSPVA